MVWKQDTTDLANTKLFESPLRFLGIHEKKAEHLIAQCSQLQQNRQSFPTDVLDYYVSGHIPLHRNLLSNIRSLYVQLQFRQI